MLETLNAIFTTIFDPTSVWSVVARAVIWFLIAGIIIVTVDTPRPNSIQRSIKRNVGVFLLILTIGGVLFYLLFNFTSQPS